MKSLYACGSNLHGHITHVDLNDSLGESQSQLITTPCMVFTDLADARVLFAGLGDVLLELIPLSPPPISPDLLLRGPSTTRLTGPSTHGGELLPPRLPAPISHGFGSSTGDFLGVVMSNHGGVNILHGKGEGDGEKPKEEMGEVWWEALPDITTREEGGAGGKGKEKGRGRIIDISVAGNEEVAVVVEWDDIDDSQKQREYTLQLYPNLAHLLSSLGPSPYPSSPPLAPTATATYPLPQTHTPTSLVSTLTSHALLLQPTPLSSPSQPHSQSTPPPNHPQHQQYPYPLLLTTGDPRHPSLLLHSQDKDKDHPPNSPLSNPLSPAAPLEGIPSLTRLVASPLGWHVAALDSTGVVYLFGGRAGGGGGGGQGLKGVVARAQKQIQDGEEEVDEEDQQQEEEDVILLTPPFLNEHQHKHAGGIPGETTIHEEVEPPGITALSLGSGHILALLDGGTVVGIGRGDEGQLGNGNGSTPSEWVELFGPGGTNEEEERDTGEGRRRKRRSGGRWGKVGKVEKVWAGAWSSWMLVDEDDDEDEDDWGVMGDGDA